MAVRSGFFNSVNGDRKYNASRFAEYFNSFISNGIFPNPSTNLQTMANDDMTVTVRAGKAWINGYILINDDDYILQIDPADGVTNRIDRIVARYDTVDREIRVEIKKGTFAINPTAPNLQRDANAFELGLADIYVGKGIIGINQGNITDLRLNRDLCGIVHGTVDQVDTTTLFNQYLTWLDEKKNQYDVDMINWTEQKQLEYENWKTQQESNMDNWQTQEQSDFNNWRNQEEQNFNAWFASIEDILDENTAGNLLNMINLTNDNLDEVNDNLAAHKADDTHIPKGLISMWSGSIATIPTGWNLCNGENGTPNLTDRFVVGAGSSYNVGDTGGEESVTLSSRQIPRHRHSSGTLSAGSAGSHSHSRGTLSTNTTGSHTHSYQTLGGSTSSSKVAEGGFDLGARNETTASSGSHSHTISGSTANGGSHSHTVSGYTDYIGSSDSHENRPPYFALAFIMKL